MTFISAQYADKSRLLFHAVGAQLCLRCLQVCWRRDCGLIYSLREKQPGGRTVPTKGGKRPPPPRQDSVRPFSVLSKDEIGLSKTGRFLSKAEILGVGVFSPFQVPTKGLQSPWPPTEVTERCQMPDIENSRKTAKKGAKWVTVKQPTNSRENSRNTRKTAVLTVFRLFFGRFGCFSGCFSAVLP